MTLRKALLEIIEDNGCSLGRSGKAALAEFLRILRQENSGSQDEADDDEEDDVDLEADDRFTTSRAIACPHCGERITVPIDLSGGDQDVVQDCEVCCSPIRVVYTVVDGKVASFSFEAS